MLRTHTCGELSKKHVGKVVTLCGWADSVRPHGKIGFISIRDKYGITQVFVGKDNADLLVDITPETTLKITGEVKARPEKLVNKEMSTGEIELSATKIEILAKALELPLSKSDKVTSSEETRMKYRYLDLRNPELQKNLELRAKFFSGMRKSMEEQGFIEVETPLLAKSTPEGARDYLVPSRKNKGKFYALPQSPQIFKQLLMVGGLDRYFQFPKCMRDEDLRADRQPEFTQMDMEMSFCEIDDVIGVTEKAIQEAFKNIGIKLEIPFPRMTYAESMKKYNSDKPDLRGKAEAKDSKYAFVWITEFPMFEYSDEQERWVAQHHPFTMPYEEDLRLLKSNPENVRSSAFDLVFNGSEVSSGSIRVTNPEIQEKIFDALNLSKEEIEHKFGFFIEAYKYGAPQHAGLALGMDRIIANICNTNIREVIAFPKTKEGEDLMMQSPSSVDEAQMKELGLKRA